MWRRRHACFTLNDEDFKGHYHRRFNVGTIFSMVKSKFGDSVRSKSETGQISETLLKYLRYTVCVLVHAMFESEVTQTEGFWCKAALRHR